MPQTLWGTLGQKVSAYQFFRIWTMFDHVSKALKVPDLVGISRSWGHSEPHSRGQTTSEVAKNWCPVRFWPKVHYGV